MSSRWDGGQESVTGCLSVRHPLEARAWGREGDMMMDDDSKDPPTFGRRRRRGGRGFASVVLGP